MGVTQKLTLADRMYAAWKALRGQSVPFQGYGQSASNQMWTAPGAYGNVGSSYSWLWQRDSRINFALEVGDLRNVSLVQAGVRWIARGLNSARLYVAEIGTDNKETEVQDDPIPALFRRPNPYYAGGALLHGIALSWLTAATAYILIVKNRIGLPAELWYEPHWTIRPRWPLDGSEEISYYEIERNGSWLRVGKGSNYPNVEVLPLRDGFDPETRMGFSAMVCLLREFYTDQRAQLFIARLLRTGVPPVVVGLGTKDMPFDGDVKEFRADLVNRLKGDHGAEPMVTAGPVDVQKLGFEYDKLGLKEIREIPEERFCAAIGVSAQSLYFGAGAKNSTYNNVQQFQAQDYRGYVVPLHSYIANEVGNVLLPMFGEPEGRQVKWDYTDTPEMQPDRAADTHRSAVLWMTGGIDRAEYREFNGYKMRPEDTGVYYAGPPLSPGIRLGAQLGADTAKRFELDGEWTRDYVPGRLSAYNRQIKGLLPSAQA